jgi:hypothetical protein
MLKKNAPRVATILACAAAFTFVAAQFPWETDADPNYDSGSSSESPSGDLYDIGSYKSSSAGGPDESGAEEANSEPSAPKPKAKPKKERAPAKDKPQRAANKRSSNTSFSAASFSGSQKTCPVCTSVRLKGNQYVDYSGGRIHVCSEACIGRVRRNPDKFADILVKRGEQVTTAQ